VNRARPNTAVDDDLLQGDVILCCGEDAGELLLGFDGLTALQYQEYRCYRFWRYPSFTLIWTGIGTGCLEPLLFEALEPGIIKRIVLIGTAGALNGNVKLGQGFVIGEAFLGCTGISPHPGVELKSQWNSPIADIPTASIVSTDYYYGFSEGNSPMVKALQDADIRLRAVMDSALGRVDLVDMETAQFYYLCRVLGGEHLQYLALKGPANSIEDVSQQTLHSESLLMRLSQTAVSLLS
jgi:hypothetical protein